MAGTGKAARPRLVVFTGAGISAPSGLGTFRGRGGLWRGHRIEQVCDGPTWRRNFALVHSFYDGLRTQLGRVAPNEAHAAVARWCRRWSGVVITQNVDDLHERAGSEAVLHVHGRLRELRCEACGRVWDVGYATAAGGACPGCGAEHDVRPNVVFFHERPPEYPRMWRILEAMCPDDALVVIGTGAEVVRIGHVAHSLSCLRIFSSLKRQRSGPSSDDLLPPGAFDGYVWGDAVESVPRIEHMIEEYLGPGIDPSPA